MTHQIDGTTTDSVTVEKFVESGNGRILVKFGDYFPDFTTSCIYASNALIESNPAALKAFLAGWFETIAYMRDHRPSRPRHHHKTDRHVARRRQRHL